MKKWTVEAERKRIIRKEIPNPYVYGKDFGPVDFVVEYNEKLLAAKKDKDPIPEEVKIILEKKGNGEGISKEEKEVLTKASKRPIIEVLDRLALKRRLFLKIANADKKTKNKPKQGGIW